MADVKVPASKDNAVLLLAAAEELGVDASEVRWSLGQFVVDEKIAEKAELLAVGEEKDTKKSAAKKTAPPKSKE